MFLAFREILRAKLRFALLSGAVALLVFLVLFQQGLLSGLITNFIGAVENQDSPVLVFNEQARSNVEGSFLFPDQVAAVAEVDGVDESAPIGQGTFTVDTRTGREDAALFGYSLGGLGEPQTLVEGRLPTADNEAVASDADEGKGFAIGDEVQVVGEDGPTLTIVGRAENLRWSVSPTVFTSYETFESAQQAVNPEAAATLPSLVAARPESGVSPEELTERIDAAVAGVESLTNQEAADNNPGVQGVRQSFNIILGLAFVVVTLVVGFFFLILTVQKAKPLTLLRAIGAPSSYLVKSLVVQIMIIMAVGIAAGLGLAALVARFSPSGDVGVVLDSSTIAITVVALFVLSLVGGLVAIRRVLQVEPIKATAGGRVL